METGLFKVRFLVLLFFGIADLKKKMQMYLFGDYVCVGVGSHSWIAAGAEPGAHQFMSRFVYKGVIRWK
jgi:hypothetical protein